MTTQLMRKAAACSRVIGVLAARAYRAILLTLLAIALLPTLMGFESFTVRSGSMEPTINVGDVTLAREVQVDERIEPGRVYLFHDEQNSEDVLVLHRVVEMLDDGRYTTAGDANSSVDADPVERSDFHSRGIILVPYIGLPVTWWQSGEQGKTLLWLGLTLLAMFAASRRLETDPSADPQSRADIRDPAEPGDQDAVPRERAEANDMARLRTAAVPTLAFVLMLSISPASASFTATSATAGSTWQVGQWAHAYTSAVLADNPTGFWRFDETSGVWAYDASDHGQTGRYGGSAQLGNPGSLLNGSGFSVRPGADRTVLNPAPVAAPQTSTMELWFSTSSTAGGTLLGFASANAWDPADRLVKMNSSGQIVYGDWNTNPYRTVTTPSRYNDGAWHHLVISATAQGNRQNVTIYIDGSAVVSGQGSAVSMGSGTWFIGPFDGLIDNAAIYHSDLSAAQALAHYRAR